MTWAKYLVRTVSLIRFTNDKCLKFDVSFQSPPISNRKKRKKHNCYGTAVIGTKGRVPICLSKALIGLEIIVPYRMNDVHTVNIVCAEMIEILCETVLLLIPIKYRAFRLS